LSTLSRSTPAAVARTSSVASQARIGKRTATCSGPGPDALSWEPFGFLRLRRPEYTDEEISVWAARIAPCLAEGRDVYCYFKHEDLGASPQMAKRLEDILRSKV